MTQITITAVFSSVADAAAFLAGTSAPAAKPQAEATATTTVASTTTPAKTKPTVVKTTPPAATLPTAEGDTAGAPETQAAPTIEYSVLQKAVFALAGLPDVGPDATKALAATFGVATFKTLDPSRWAEALAAVKARTVELETEIAEAEVA